MRLYEIIGNTPDEVFNKMLRARSILMCISNHALPSTKTAKMALEQLDILNEDPDNLLKWVLKDPDIAREYNKIPAKYRKL